MHNPIRMEQELIIGLTYVSDTEVRLRLVWDVIHVVRAERGAIMNSVVLARDMDGNIIRQIGFFPDQWERVADEHTLRACQACFDDRDRLLMKEKSNAAK